MELIPNPLKTALERVLTFHDARQELIASNLANASTPRYTAFDLVLRDRLVTAAPLAPARSDARHLSQTGDLERTGGELQRSGAPARLDGNNVRLEEEFVKLIDNRMRYQALVELLDRWNGLGAIARELR
jgi:flagellar basal-body rod protein FlgB